MSLLRMRKGFLTYNLFKCKQLLPFIFIKKSISYLGKWRAPKGHNTGITVYNSAVNEKVPLILKKKDILTWYICGPTVYADTHIGHASCYVKFDIIRRILENVFNINVFLLLGITNIDDKIIKKSNEIGMSAFHLANKYELDFFEDMEAMNVLPPTVISRVSENIPAIISFCEKLIEKDYAYSTSEGNVYFMVSKGVTADVLHEVPDEVLRDIQSDPLKKDSRDFALWKATKPNEPFWESPWGKGRPGWHIECSAMASKIFGSEVDLHSGGSDLLFPHHSNELSQSNAYHNCSQWVHYWLHAGLLHVDENCKMSKSVGNTITIKEFLKEHYVNDFRVLCLQSRYRKNLLYNSETLSGAKFLHKKIHNFINDCESYICGEIQGPPLEEEKILSKLTITKEQITNSLRNDFNTSNALLCLTDFIDEINKNLSPSNISNLVIPSNITTISSCYMYVKSILDIFGISIPTKKVLPRGFVFSLDSIINFRNKIRLFALNPKVTGNGVFASYIDKTYKTMQTELEINFQNKMYSKFLIEVLEDSKIFHEKVSQFVRTFEANENLTLFDEMASKEKKKIMSPLFVYCDEFRSVLNEKGIGIKDRATNSTWMPLIELQKLLFLSCK